MKDKSAWQLASTRRRGQTQKPTRKERRDARKAAKEERRAERQLIRKKIQAILSTPSPHLMTLRSSCAHVDSQNSQTSLKTTQVSHVDTSSLPALSTTEPVVRASSTVPPGYSFVPKGDPYMTRNCRKRTQQAHQVVYAVVDDKKTQIGIRVPLPIHTAVLESAKATRDHRELLTKKRDEDIEERFRMAILKQFPRMPPEEIRKIIRHTTKKGKGRVGRTGKLDLAVKAYLATHAHTRHTKTDYDGLLKTGTDRKAARSRTIRSVFGVLDEWGLVTKRRQAKKAGKQIPTKSTQKTKDGATISMPTDITKRVRA
ncbi:hypothetical protein FHL15_005166 [Xylaria flabelliformis]|uniref:DUF2293 domain-containing protein n=1 Tax=Xylaria flabelliformis TaxID=2512241 RepID=A0A553I1L7_9PEZI|nr:hypothetical protein FHL15_005166 [Xylaria flabelliformis]